MSRRLVVGITGASGVIYGIRALEVLNVVPDIETDLVLSSGARTTIAVETDRTMDDEVLALADVVHHESDIGASIASGSCPGPRHAGRPMQHQDPLGDRELLCG